MKHSHAFAIFWVGYLILVVSCLWTAFEKRLVLGMYAFGAFVVTTGIGYATAVVVGERGGSK